MGPRLLFGTVSDLRRRCDVASVRLTHSEPGYAPGALIPCDDWHPLTAAEAENLRPNDTTPDQTLIELVHRQLPPLDPDDLRGRLEAAASLDPLNGRWPTGLLGCAASPGNWTTTTEDSTIGRRIGLHVDNFDRLPYATRHHGRRRLCLNLGPGTRYLLIGDRDVQYICRTLHTDLDHHYPHTEDVRRHVAAGHRLRCLRIHVQPGDGYIAPTELLPHDGSTMNSAEPSVAAFWLGRQPVAREPSLP
ncbi:hypothetical protein [Streptomyces sp. NPDC093568]|uniref:hypothetical protein n=1 Tax=Streptomyces sp. NPDC093568 TaxID=3366041 RepID=UPI0037F8793C